MTQDERWIAKYNEVKTFISVNHCNPSKYGPEERFKFYNGLKHNRQLLNAGEMREKRIELIRKMLALCGEYKSVNQWC